MLDGGRWKDGTEALLPSVDIAICSRSFAPQGVLAEDRGAVHDYLIGHGVTWAASTDGPNDILYASADGAGSVAVDQEAVFDTLGAGDIFHGAFCYFYAARGDVVRALGEAARVASASCRSFGTRAWMTGALQRS